MMQAGGRDAGLTRIQDIVTTRLVLQREGEGAAARLPLHAHVVALLGVGAYRAGD